MGWDGKYSPEISVTLISDKCLDMVGFFAKSCAGGQVPAKVSPDNFGRTQTPDNFGADNSGRTGPLTTSHTPLDNFPRADNFQRGRCKQKILRLTLALLYLSCITFLYLHYSVYFVVFPFSDPFPTAAWAPLGGRGGTGGRPTTRPLAPRPGPPDNLPRMDAIGWK